MEEMRYNFQERIHSLKISKQLIIDIEKYLLEDMLNHLDIKEKIKSDIDYSVKISDKYGQITYNNIQSYKRNNFSNNIKSIEIRFSMWKPIHININIEFSNDFFIVYSKNLTIEVYSNKCKYYVSTVHNSLKDIFNSYKLNNPFFISVIIDTFLFSILFFTIALSIKYFGTPFISSLLLIINGFIIYYFISKFIQPYYEFDNNRNVTLKKYASFINLGLIGYIIFNILIPFLIHYLI